jgi:hypothetical protein
MRWSPVVTLTLLLAGCGDRMVDGHFLGDTTLRLHGSIGSVLGNPQHATVGAAWLGYTGLVDPAAGIETTVLPIAIVDFPSGFQCDILDPPPSAGRYALPGHGVVPAFVRLARLVLLDDANLDQRFAIDEALRLVLPDRLMARSDGFALLYVEKPPLDVAANSGLLLEDWTFATPGYHVLDLGPSSATTGFLARVVPNDTRVIFAATPSEQSF